MQKWQTIYAVSARHIPSDENTGRSECMPTDESGDAALAEGRTAVRPTTGRAEGTPTDESGDAALAEGRTAVRQTTGHTEGTPTDESGDAAFAEGRTAVRQTTGRAEDGDKTRPNRATDICTADARTPRAKRRKCARKKLKKEAGR